MFIRTLIFCFLLIILGFLFFYIFQRNFIYYPLKDTPLPDEFGAGDMHIIKLTTEDNLMLNAWYMPSQDKKPVILFLHGNAGHIGYRVHTVQPFLDKGYGIFLLEYRGYGGNKGSPSEEGLYKDARAAVKFLKENGITLDKIALYGESLGTGVVTQLATEAKFCGLILQSPYLSFKALAKVHYPFLFLPLRDKYDNFEKIKKIHTPLLILHGQEDRVVPFEQGKFLFENAKEPKYFLPLEDKGHMGLTDDLTTQDFIFDFLKEHCV